MLGTSGPNGQPHVPLHAMALNLAYYAAGWAALALCWYCPKVAAAAAAAHLLTPLALPTRLLGGALSRLRVWDGIRATYQIEYAEPGTPGAFDEHGAAAAAAAATPLHGEGKGGGEARAPLLVTAIAGGSGASDAPSASASRAHSSDEGSSDGRGSDSEDARAAERIPAAAITLAADEQPPARQQAPASVDAQAAVAEVQAQLSQGRQHSRFIFCYHPHGFLARGAVHTFAARGRGSPISGLPDCRLAAGSWLLRVPLMQQALLAIGCVDASYSNLLSLLTSRKV
jgi:hypothetical protein